MNIIYKSVKCSLASGTSNFVETVDPLGYAHRWDLLILQCVLNHFLAELYLKLFDPIVVFVLLG